MKYYCKDCKIVFDETSRCPACGSKKIAPAKDDDVCLLCEKEMIWSEVLTDVLKDNGIPCYKRGVLGAGLAMKIGAMFEKDLFYVNYRDLDRAKELTEELFSKDGGAAENTKFGGNTR